MSEQSLWADDDVVGAALGQPASSGKQRWFSVGSFAVGVVGGFVVGVITGAVALVLLVQAMADF